MTSKQASQSAPGPEAFPSGIALFIPDLGGGGAERVVVNLANEFSRRGITTYLVLARATGPLLDVVSEDVCLADLKCPSRAMAPLLLAQWLRRTQPNVLSSHMDIANVVAALASKLAGFKGHLQHVVHIHVSSQKNHHRRLKDSLVFALCKRVYPKADSIVAVSDGVKEDLESSLALPPNSVTRIYNPIITDSFETLAAEPVFHEWIQDSQLPLITSAGRLHGQKDFATLIRAVGILKADGNPVRLLILGDGPEKQELARLVEQLGLGDSVQLIGYVENPLAYIHASNAFVLSSFFEGFGNVLVEALACGTSVVSTDCPSGPAEILDNGRYGALVPVGDVTAMAEAIRRTLLKKRNDPNDFTIQTRTFRASPVADAYLIGFRTQARRNDDRTRARHLR
ncbi:glycosyltransferase [Salinisphaera sp.]|uniref:glycosyltransferase n=1 Tax=Salinisphaera sp. TaxID=1914330 RepID=UPI000C540022|nr:glycosyltransferase [Salinisphaera sp.]MBS62893.1 glycosyl transferase [Salinisphaera sp.]